MDAENQNARANRKQDANMARLRRRREMLGRVGIGLAVAALLGLVTTVVWTIVAAAS